jgi:hypothetical protein
MKIACGLLVAACLALAAPGVQAGQGAKDAAESFKDAQKQYDEKSYDDALASARAALDATGSPNARLYVARSLRELGRLDQAYTEMQRTVKDATALAEKEKKYEPTRDAAAAELALLERRVGKVVVALVDAPPGAQVTLNGKELEAYRIGIPIAVNPGDVVLEANAEGAAPVQRQIRIAAGETQTVTLVFKAEATGAGAGKPPPTTTLPPDTAAPRHGGGLRTAGFVVAGVGVAGLAVFAVTGSMANSKFSQLESECGSKRCSDPKYADTVDSGKRYETIANVGLAVGAVGLLAGGAMILFGGPSVEKTGTASVGVTPGGFTLDYARRF